MRGFIPPKTNLTNKGLKNTTKNGIIRTPDYKNIIGLPVLTFDGYNYTRTKN